MKPYSFIFTTALIAACVSAPRGEVVVARSRLGAVTVAELDRYLAQRALGASQDLDAASRRQRLEDLLIVRAAEEEAERLGLLETPEGRARVVRAQEEILVTQMRARIEAAVAAAVAVDETAVAAAYAERAKLPALGERLRLRHVFKRLSANATAEERRSAEATLRALLAELRAGADFAALARAHSDSQTASFGGLIAPVTRDDLDPALGEILWRLDAGEITDVVVTPVGLHVFKLEERLPPPPAASPEPLRAAIRAELEHQARETGLKRRFDELLQTSGADFQPHLLDDPAIAATTVVFALDGVKVETGEIARRWRGLSFVARRSTSLRSLLEEEAGRLLLLHEARRLDLASEPETADRLTHARRRLLYVAAEERRVAELAGRVTEKELRDFYAQEHARSFRPERRRLRGVIVPLTPDRSPHAVYDDLDRVARGVRAGTDDLAAAARRLSHDPSRAEDGDLGWAEAKDLAVWAGPRVTQAVFAQAVGEVSAPLLVEVYDPRRLRDDPTAYLVVRVEEARPETTAAFEEVAEEVRKRYLASQAGEIGRQLRAAYLEAIGAVFFDEPRAGSPTGAH